MHKHVHIHARSTYMGTLTYMLPRTLTSDSSLVYNKTIMRIVTPGDNVTMTREALSAVTAGRRLIGWGLVSTLLDKTLLLLDGMV